MATPRADALPEFRLASGEYKDEGCAWGGPSCLRCALPDCFEDLTPPMRREAIEKKKLEALIEIDRPSLELRLQQVSKIKGTAKDVAAELGVSIRAAYRWRAILKAKRKSEAAE